MRGDAPFPYRVHGTAYCRAGTFCVERMGPDCPWKVCLRAPCPRGLPSSGLRLPQPGTRHGGMTFPIHLRGAAACKGQITRKAVPPTKMSLSSLACMTRVKSHLWESREKSVVPKGGCGSQLRPGNEGSERLRSWGVDSLACWAQWAVSPIPCHQGAFHPLPLEPCSPTPRDWG